MVNSTGGSSASPKEPQLVFYSSEFMTAALLAPASSLLVALLTSGVWAVLGPARASPWEVILPFLFLLVIVSLWGAVPSILFGGAVLWAIRALDLPVSYPVLAGGGGAAAALYVASGLALAVILPPLAMMIAPWAMLHQIGSSSGRLAPAQADDLLVLGCIVLGGVAAGLIYARSVLRG